MQRRHVHRVLALGTAFLVTLATGGSTASGVGTSVGQTAASPAAVVACAGPSFTVQATEDGAPSYATTTGVITSWSVMPGQGPGFGGLVLKVLRKNTAPSYTVTGTSDLRTPAGTTLNTFPVQIPVAAGDRLGLFIPTGQQGPCSFTTASAADTVGESHDSSLTDRAVGATYPVDNTLTNVRLNLAVDIEPDADKDGFGDLTQDGCPVRTDTHLDCVPPDTTVTPPKTARTTKQKAKVTLFFASEPGAAFTCSVDGRPAKSCASPFRVKLKVGKHYIAVTATDAAGNLDPTPASVKVLVKRKRT